MKRAKDIAAELGISAATLSLVANGKPGISEKTRTKVLEQLRFLGYDYLIHDSIQDISNSSTDSVDSANTIGFIIYKNHGKLLGFNSFFPLILEGIETTARQYGYNLVVINMDKSDITNQISYITEANCTGYVIFATEMQLEEIHPFEELGIPFVLFDNYFKEIETNSVKVNNEQGTYLAVKHLYDMGHRQIGYLSSGLDIRSFRERQYYATKAIKELTGTMPDENILTIGYPHQNAEEGLTTFLSEKKAGHLPSAFLADNDLVAAGAIQAFKKAGYKIPDDVSIIGYDDRPICTMLDPLLSTIQLPRGRFGAEAIDQLVRFINNSKTGHTKVEINGNLIIRDSVKRIK